MVSNASEDLPDPLRPVITVKLLRGISTSMFLRLCWRAPRTEILVMAINSESDALQCPSVMWTSAQRCWKVEVRSSTHVSYLLTAASVNAGRFRERGALTERRKDPGLRLWQFVRRQGTWVVY